jgi:hypothetical protein
MTVLADPTTSPYDLTRPGHINPLRALEGGVLRRAGHTEAAVDLCRMAGLRPTGVICEIVSEKDGNGMARLEELKVFAASTAWPSSRSPTSSPGAAAPRSRSSGSPRPRSRPRTASSARWATARSWTTPTTSRWCAATSVTGRTSWSGCTRSA